MRTEDLDALLLAALREDAPWGDRTTDALGLAGDGRGIFLAKEALVVCGLPAALRVFFLTDPSCKCDALVPDGTDAPAGAAIAKVSGPFPALLLAERIALNLLQRLCGVATRTREAVKEVAGSGARVCDTRKTTPLLRHLEKYAVRMGGGTNHRMGLSDGVLIKDNHIAAAGSIGGAVRRARERAGHLWKVEVEVDSLAGFREAIAAGAEAILLDNMSDGAMAQAVRERPAGVLLEASGNMTADRLARVAALGVDLISMGALTHSARACDISLELEACPA
jgi:nicotinate-nucleotide pyrophosphorylase (carboxylating)